METIAKVLLWAVWNASSILALPIYALKNAVKITIATLKEWSMARKALKEKLMPWKAKVEPEEKKEEEKSE